MACWAGAFGWEELFLGWLAWGWFRALKWYVWVGSGLAQGLGFGLSI